MAPMKNYYLFSMPCMKVIVILKVYGMSLSKSMFFVAGCNFLLGGSSSLISGDWLSVILVVVGVMVLSLVALTVEGVYGFRLVERVFNWLFGSWPAGDWSLVLYTLVSAGLSCGWVGSWFSLIETIGEWTNEYYGRCSGGEK